MPLTDNKIEAFQKKVVDLTDVPSENMPPSEIKAWLDSSPEELRIKLNTLIDGLTSTTTDSGAKNIGVETINGLTGNDVQTLLNDLKIVTDNKTDKTGNHAGTWGGLTVPEIGAGDLNGSRIDSITTQLADIATNIRNFGAIKDNGNIDNIPFINNAINYVSTNGGGQVIIPEGTFYVKPTLGNKINLKSNVQLVGYGRGSIIKVADDAGNYYSIFGQEDWLIQIKDILLTNFKIDQNPTRSAVYAVDIPNGIKHFGIQLVNYFKLAIKQVYFEDTYGVNCINLSSKNAIDTRVMDNEINFVMGKSASGTYDNSAIYCSNKGAIITGNRIKCVSATPSLSGYGGIECAGDNVVSHNIIDGYQTGIHLSPVRSEYMVDPNVSSNVVISSNVMLNMQYGILLWGYSGRLMDGVIISENNIKIANKSKGYTDFGGIVVQLKTDCRGDLQNIDISSNIISFEKEDRGDILDPESTVGIRLGSWGGSLRHITCDKNIINNAPTRAIILGATSVVPDADVKIYDNIKLTNNVINNPGYNTGTTNIYKKVGIEVYKGTFNSTYIENNTIFDDMNPFMSKTSFHIVSTVKGSVVLRNNNVTAKNGKFTFLNELPINSGFILETKDDVYTQQTSYTSGVSIIDTSISLPTDFKANSLFFVEVIGNTNADASTRYGSISAGYLAVYCGHNGTNLVYRLKYTEIFNAVGGLNFAKPLTVIPIFFDGTTEQTEVTSLTNMIIRLKISGYATGKEATSQLVKIKKVFNY